MLNIYKLYNDKDNLLYIGKTKNIHQRINQHLAEKNKISWKSTIDKIMIAEVDSDIDLELYETYLINKLKPIYNGAKLYNNNSKIELKDLNFYEYIKRDNKLQIYKYDDRVLGFCYKLYLFKGFGSFKVRDLLIKFNMSKSKAQRLVLECLSLNLIEHIGDGLYKLSNDFII